jgi:hypothetical protein
LNNDVEPRSDHIARADQGLQIAIIEDWIVLSVEVLPVRVLSARARP